VFVLVGDADGIERAILSLFDLAVAAIDLRAHTGVHPRIGAVDVVPFVPIAGVTMAECVALARKVAPQVAERFHLPVYLYEDAALRTGRTRLEDIRRGQFEGLAAKMASSAWTPDFGPSTPHPTAGATVIGARMPLVAYNINLQTDRLDIAKAIARAVRFSSGGLPFVKAMGVPLAHLGIVQVSMNLTNYEQTPMRVVFDAVKREAELRGVDILESELIGLVPAAALSEETARHILLHNFRADQILENRLTTDD
jgi:glutamate formiminotransferase